MNIQDPVVRLKNAWRSSHPWIFQKLVEKPAVRPKPGAIVEVIGVDGEWIGRGFYNSYNAKNPLARFPLDHIFHSEHFKLIRLERLPAIGSDHFPIYAELLYAPEAPAEQEPSKKKAGDEAQAKARLEKEREDAATGADRPGRF